MAWTLDRDTSLSVTFCSDFIYTVHWSRVNMLLHQFFCFPSYHLLLTLQRNATQHNPTQHNPIRTLPHTTFLGRHGNNVISTHRDIAASTQKGRFHADSAHTRDCRLRQRVSHMQRRLWRSDHANSGLCSADSRLPTHCNGCISDLGSERHKSFNRARVLLVALRPTTEETRNQLTILHGGNPCTQVQPEEAPLILVSKLWFGKADFISRFLIYYHKAGLKTIPGTSCLIRLPRWFRRSAYEYRIPT